MKQPQAGLHNAERLRKGGGRALNKYFFTYLLILPAALLTLFFAYLPMPGLIMAFMDFDIFKGFSSPWVGFQNIKEIFAMPMFSSATLNTLYVSFLNLIIVFPIPILFAILLNELKDGVFKSFVQTVSYLPHFLSWIAVVGMAQTIYANYGIINDVLVAIGGEGTKRITFLAKQELFVPNLVILNLWKTFGWNSVIYLAAITGIDAEMYDAAKVDGANRFRQCLHITIPSIMPTAIMLFILQIGSIFSDNFDLIYGLQNVYIEFETISTLVYKQGISSGNYSVATAIGFVQGTIGLVLVLCANAFSKKINDVALW